MAHVELELCTILTTKECVALEVISKLTLESPLARSSLCGIRIKSSKSISMLISKSRHIVEECRSTSSKTVRAERHILATLSLEQSAYTSVRIRS